jgi:3,4-dihydroxyphenylacetate 2,3-dioxygenase
MSGGLIACGVAAHTPRIGIEKNAPVFQLGLISGLREMGQAIRAMRPDVIVLQSAHWVSTFNWYVTAHRVHEGICIADEAPDIIPGIPYRRKGDPEMALALRDKMVGAGIPCGVNDVSHYTFDYASLVPIQYLDPEAEVPMVTLPSVVCSEIEECVTVGRLVHKAAEASGRRAVFISSCALSHKVVRGPDKWPSPELQALDRRFIELALGGQAKALHQFLPEFSRAAVAEMGGRTISGMIGAMEALEKARGPLVGRQYGTYAQSSGSGNANICVTPKAA